MDIRQLLRIGDSFSDRGLPSSTVALDTGIKSIPQIGYCLDWPDEFVDASSTSISCGYCRLMQSNDRESAGELFSQ
ncbi:MAG: hypothetical protein R3C26_11795 [Calditrichia bacterium]